MEENFVETQSPRKLPARQSLISSSPAPRSSSTCRDSTKSDYEDAGAPSPVAAQELDSWVSRLGSSSLEASDAETLRDETYSEITAGDGDSSIAVETPRPQWMYAEARGWSGHRGCHEEMVLALLLTIIVVLAILLCLALRAQGRVGEDRR